LGAAIKIYQAKDTEKINKLKFIIYQSFLEELATSRGLLKE
jgi:hypothetical protein